MGEKANLIDSPPLSAGLAARAGTAVVGTVQAVGSAAMSGVTSAISDEVAETVRDLRTGRDASTTAEGSTAAAGIETTREEQ